MVMYMCVKYNDFASASVIFLLNFGTVQTMWYFSFNFVPRYDSLLFFSQNADFLSIAIMPLFFGAL